MTLIKICGITDVEDAQLAIELGADMIGLILTPTSKRFLNMKKAKELIEAININTLPIVGVFSEEPIAEIARTIEKLKLSWVQLRAPEKKEDLKLIDHLNKIIVICVGYHGEYKKVEYKLKNNDLWAYDGMIQGSGRQFDWNNFTRHETGPYFLAGGLNIDNISHAIEELEPDGVDVVSGVSYSDGIKKDPQLLKTFIEKARHGG